MLSLVVVLGNSCMPSREGYSQDKPPPQRMEQRLAMHIRIKSYFALSLPVAKAKVLVGNFYSLVCV